MKSKLVRVGVVATLVVSSAAWAVTQAPDYMWRRPAFYEPYVGRFASASGMVGVADLGSCYVVRTGDGFLVKAFAINGFYCGAASLSPDGRFLALSGAAYLGSLRIYVYEIADWTRVAVFTGSDYTGEAIFSPDGRYLLESSAGFYTPVYDVATWTLQRSLPGQAPSVSPDSRLVALASRTGSPSIHLFRLEDGSEVTPPSGYPHAGYHLLGNDWIALAANDEIRIETLTEPPQVIATLYAPQIFRLVISPDAQILAGVVDDGNGGRLLQLWETKGFSSLRIWTISPNNYAGVAFASNDSIVSSNSTSDDARVDLWRVSDGTLLLPLNADTGIYTALVYSPDGSDVVGGFGPNGNILAWRASDGEYVQMIAGSGRLTELLEIGKRFDRPCAVTRHVEPKLILR